MIDRLMSAWKGLVARPTIDYTEGRYFQALVTPEDKAQRVYTYNASQAELLMRATGYVNICAALNAMYCASVPIKLYSKGTKGRKVKGMELEWLRRGMKGKAASYANRTDDVVEVMDAPVKALLSNPNFSDTGNEFIRLTYYFLEVCGNDYWQHDGTAQSEPKNLFNLFPQWTMPTIDDTGITAYRFGRNYANREEIPASNVIQFRHIPSPQNPWLGVGCLNGSTVEADIYASAIVYEQSFWNNGARPDFALKLPTGSTEDQVKQAHAMLERRHQGARKGGKPIVTVGDDMEIKQLQWSPREMEYESGVDRMRRTILNAFGVPLALLEMNSTSLGSGGKEFEARAQYRSQTIAPRVASMCDRLNENLIPCFGYQPGEVWFGYDNPDGEDQKTIEESSRDDADMAILTINEARAVRGRDPLPDGDELRYKGVPLKDVAKIQQAAASATADKNQPPEKKNIDGDRVNAKTFYARKLIVCGHGSVGCECHKDADIGEQPSVYDDALHLEDSLEAIMRRYYEAVDPTDFDKRKESRELRDELVVILLLLFQRGYESGTERLRAAGVNSPIPTWADGGEAATAFTDEYIPHLARTVANTIAETISEAKTEYAASGSDPANAYAFLKDRISGLATFGPKRVAETETVRAFNTGTEVAWQKSGVVVKKVWRTAENEKVCPFCNSLDGAEAKIGEPFFETGHTMTVGEISLVFDYSAIYGPALHPLCQCYLDFVLGDQ